ncbi:MAG: hypothetical protein P8Y93_14605, partial [Acidobacteriota bacterium]
MRTRRRAQQRPGGDDNPEGEPDRTDDEAEPADSCRRHESRQCGVLFPRLQRHARVTGALQATAWIAFEAPLHQVAEARRGGGRQCVEIRFGAQHRGDDIGHRLALEQLATGQHLPHN